MNRFMMLILVVGILLVPALGEVFDLPANGTWIKVQDGSITQWSATPQDQPKTRIDLVSSIEDGKRASYYLIRSACSDDTVAVSTIKAGNKLGIGLDCKGSMVATSIAVLNSVKKLPAEAEALLKQ